MRTRTEALEAALRDFLTLTWWVETGGLTITFRSDRRSGREVRELRLLRVAAQAALDAAPREEPGEPDYEHAARIAEKWAAHYPVDVFPEDGTSLDAKAAKHGRHVAKMIAEDIRKAAQNVAPHPPEARTTEAPVVVGVLGEIVKLMAPLESEGRRWVMAWLMSQDSYTVLHGAEKAAHAKGYAAGVEAGRRDGIKEALQDVAEHGLDFARVNRSLQGAPSAPPAPLTEKETP